LLYKEMRGKGRLLVIFTLILAWNFNVGAAMDNFDEGIII